VTSLAADAVADLELRPALVGRDVVGVTVEADLRCAGTGQTEVCSDALRLGELERAIGLRVAILARPRLVFVQRYVLARRGSELAVTNGRGAGSDAKVLVVSHARVGSKRRPRRNDQERDDNRLHLSVTHQGLPFASRNSFCISCRFSGRDPRRPKTAIWLPVSSTPRSRSKPRDRLSAGLPVA